MSEDTSDVRAIDGIHFDESILKDGCVDNDLGDTGVRQVHHGRIDSIPYSVESSSRGTGLDLSGHQSHNPGGSSSVFSDCTVRAGNVAALDMSGMCSVNSASKSVVCIPPVSTPNSSLGTPTSKSRQACNMEEASPKGTVHNVSGHQTQGTAQIDSGGIENVVELLHQHKVRKSDPIHFTALFLTQSFLIVATRRNAGARFPGSTDFAL